MTPRRTHMLARWCVMICIVSNFLLIPARSFALTPEEPSDRDSPSLTLKPSSGPPGTKFTAKGSNFKKCGPVTLSWDGASQGVDVKDDGSFKTNLAVPDETEPGLLTVMVVSSDCDTVTKKFRVVAAATPTPAPTTRPSPRTRPLPPQKPASPPSPPTMPTPQAMPPPDSFAANDYVDEHEIIPGKLIENLPEQMRVGETERIEARITREEISAEIYKDLKGRGAPDKHDLRITAKMQVELKGDPEVFDIRPMCSSIQSMVGNYTEWSWNVRPLSSGTHPLAIKATLIHQGETFKDLGSYEYEITVAVNPVYSTGR